MSAIKEMNDVITREVISNLISQGIKTSGKSVSEVKDVYKSIESHLESVPENMGLMITKINKKIVIVVIEELNKMQISKKPTIINLQELIEEELF